MWKSTGSMVAAAGPLLAVEPELLRLLGRSAADLAAAGRKASDVAALVAVLSTGSSFLDL